MPVKMVKIRIRILIACVCTAWLGAIGAAASRSFHANTLPAAFDASASLRAGVANTQTPARSAAGSSTPARALVTEYCINCHNETLKRGNLVLDKAEAEQVFNAPEIWEKVIV